MVAPSLPSSSSSSFSGGSPPPAPFGGGLPHSTLAAVRTLPPPVVRSPHPPLRQQGSPPPPFPVGSKLWVKNNEKLKTDENILKNLGKTNKTLENGRQSKVKTYFCMGPKKVETAEKHKIPHLLPSPTRRTFVEFKFWNFFIFVKSCFCFFHCFSWCSCLFISFQIFQFLFIFECFHCCSSFSFLSF